MAKMKYDITTNIPNVSVHITKNDAHGIITLHAYAIQSDTGQRLDCKAPLKRTAKNESEAISAEKHLVQAVIKRLSTVPSVRRENTREGLDANHPMVKVFHELASSGDSIDNWPLDWRRRSLIYFERHVLPRLMPYMDKAFEDEDRDALCDELTEEILGNGRSRQNLKIAKETAREHLSNADKIYRAMHREAPALPGIALAYTRRGKRYYAEQVKSLPRAVRRRFAQRLRELIAKEPNMVICAVVMWDAGLRTAEAAAIIPALDIEYYNAESGTFASVHVNFQEKGGKRDPHLKSPSAYRTVPLSFWGISIIEQCLEYLPDDPDVDPDKAPVLAAKLSKWVLQQLKESGCSEDYIDAARAAEYADPDREDDGSPYYDLTAYVLRRDCCSRWHNICGLTQVDCDELLGHRHKIPRQFLAEYKQSSVQIALSKQLERYVYDEEISNHPYYRPYLAVHGTDVDVIPFEAFHIVNNGNVPVRILFDLTALIAGESLIIRLPGNKRISGLHKRRINGNGVRSPATPIIGTGQILFPRA